MGVWIILGVLCSLDLRGGRYLDPGVWSTKHDFDSMMYCLGGLRLRSL